VNTPPLRRLVRRLALYLLLCAGSASGQHQHHAGHGTPAVGKSAELGATAAVDAQGIFWVAHKDGGHVVVSRSADLGRSWSKPVRVAVEAEGTDTGGDARPKVAIGSGGEVYVTWTRPLSKPYTGEIRFSRSVDGGQSFTAPITVHADRQEITHRFDAISVNRAGQIFVAWIDKRDGVAAGKAKALDYRGAAVYFAVSDDRGASFRGDYKLAEHSCECCRIALLPRDDGSVFAFWRHVFEPNIRDHALAAMYPDGRAGVLERATFDDWRVDACPHHGPSLAQDAQERLHAVWFTQPPGDAGVFYGRLRTAGVDGKRRVGGNAAEHADLAIIGRRVAVAWKEFDGERSQLRAMISEDGGDNWREHRLASTGGASDQPRVLVWKDRFYVFWNTRNEPLSVNVLP
jgi:hypothetical protein